MAHEVLMPRLSDTMEEGTIARWVKQVGDRVEKGEVLAEVETDKANMECMSFFSGVLSRIVAQEGQTVKIGDVIAVIAGEGEEAATASRAPQTQAASTPQPSTRTAPEEPERSQTGPSVQPHDESSSASSGTRLFVTPLARRLAQERHIDLRQVKGSGPGGRITRDDVDAFTLPSAAAAASVEPTSTTLPRIKQPSRMQQIIARRMVESKTQVPHFYVRTEVDLGSFLDLRAALNKGVDKDQQVRIDAMLIRACALVIARFPEVNASYIDGHFEYHEDINVGFAVSLPEGLVVPVVRQCDRKGVRQIDQEMRPLIERARALKSTTADLEECTFSISNLGMYGVEEFNAVVNPPNAAILAVGATQTVPAVVDGVIAIRQRVKLTLSCDHRILYGAPAAQFLQELQRILENPYEILL
ncbi:MAG: 2-oxo acid dehydrogenase subunit E2 [Chloroflexi bacterium]|nr:2-oxo acid dehydrogenase subunit E2 [Chloroflexota bacterium]